MREILFTISDGTEIRGSSWKPNGKCKAAVILIHGLGEHFGRYHDWVLRLNGSGYAVLGADLPGHGISGGKRGHIASYELTEEIIDYLMRDAGTEFPGIPLVLYGHSLGGGIVLSYLLKRNAELCCAVVTSPWLKLSFEPKKLKLWLAMVAKRVSPNLVQPSELIVNYISRDPEKISLYNSDPLVHDRISVSLFNEAVTAARYVLKNASLLRTPLLLMHGGADMITSPDGSRLFSLNAPDTDLKVWDGGYHELHNDIINDEVFGYLTAWLDQKTEKRKQG
jgi:alpha-beta hydrolase superfamily lysophospholipase